jgi:hypothetical protein
MNFWELTSMVSTQQLRALQSADANIASIALLHAAL